MFWSAYIFWIFILSVFLFFLSFFYVLPPFLRSESIALRAKLDCIAMLSCLVACREIIQLISTETSTSSAYTWPRRSVDTPASPIKSLSAGGVGLVFASQASRDAQKST